MGQILSTSQEALQQEQKTVELLKGAKVGLTTDVMFCYNEVNVDGTFSLGLKTI